MTGPRRFTTEDIARIVEMRTRGVSYQRIVHALGFGSTSTVAYQCLKLGIDPLQRRRKRSQPKMMEVRRGNIVMRRFTAEEDARILQLRSSGIGCKEIGKQLGRGGNTILMRLMALARHQQRADEQGAGA